MDNFCQHLMGSGCSVFFKAWNSKYMHTTLPIIYSTVVHSDLFCLSNLSWTSWTRLSPTSIVLALLLSDYSSKWKTW